jgi:arginine deiminase
MPNLFAALAAAGMPLEPLFAGGTHRTTQEREQWSSACNFVAVRPGQVITYDRNEATLGELEGMGFAIVPSGEFLNGHVAVKPGERVAITVEGSEIVRGGGGPRCMTLPLRRGEP